MEDIDKIGLVLLVLALIPLIAITEPHGLVAVLGATLMLGMVRSSGPRQ